MTTSIRPGTACPALDVALLNGDRIAIGKLPADERSLIVFYRGLHCPKCKAQLQAFDAAMMDFADRGIRPVAISMDSERRARDTEREWQIGELPIGYALDERVARDWGLFISNAAFDYEPKVFCEPGLFLVEPDGTLYAAWIQSTPFARPRCEDLLRDIEFVNKKQYPARGKAA